MTDSEDVDNALDHATEVVERADELAERIDASNPDFDRLFRYAKSNRRLGRICLALTIGLAVVVLLGGIVAVQVVRNSEDIANAQAVASAVARASRFTCETGNEARRGEAELWSFLIGGAAPSNDPVQQDRIAAVTAIVDRIFAERDCAALFPDV